MQPRVHAVLHVLCMLSPCIQENKTTEAQYEFLKLYGGRIWNPENVRHSSTSATTLVAVICRPCAALRLRPFEIICTRGVFPASGTEELRVGTLERRCS